MKVIDFSKREFKKVPELQLSKQILNTEARLYLYQDKNKWNKQDNIIKIFYNNEIMNDKLYTIGQLLKYESIIDMEELVMPTGIVSIDKEMVGYIMPYIDSNINMKIILDNDNVPLKDKLKYLKDILSILKKIELIKPLEGKFYLGDIHESNFIFDINEQKMKAVDMDSAYINNSHIPVSKFLTFNENLWDYPRKYKMNEEDRHIPSHNTQTLSFIYMLLNVLSGELSHKWSISEYYLYLNCLEKMGMSKNVIDALYKVYTKSPRLDFDEELLEEIDYNKNYSLQLRK